MDTLVQETHEVLPERDLTAHDHCDRCGTHVAAFGGAYKDYLTLHFCGHHLNEFRVTLIATGWEILDQTDKINKKPMSGSPE